MRRRSFLVSLIKAALLSFTIAALAGPGARRDSVPSRLIAFDSAIELSPERPWEKQIDPEILWTELVVSWNADLVSGAKLTVEACLDGTDHWYTLGVWTGDKATRKSIKDQKIGEIKVDTDTLVVPETDAKVNLRLTSEKADLRLVTLCFANRKNPVATTSKSDEALGTVLEPPRRAQMSYPNGEVICSATATSMILGYWAKELERPELDVDVPAVCEGVFDPEWPGTGNWPFNTAFAGSQPGIRGYVARLWNIEQLQSWIARGIPVACSVSNQMLQGKEKGKNDGHLVVLVGFTAEGDPIFNDPGRNVVRMTYKRSDFDAAWATSGRTCYMIYPTRYSPPANRDRCWVD